MCLKGVVGRHTQMFLTQPEAGACWTKVLTTHDIAPLRIHLCWTPCYSSWAAHAFISWIVHAIISWVVTISPSDCWNLGLKPLFHLCRKTTEKPLIKTLDDSRWPQSHSQTLQVTPVSSPDPTGDPSLIPRPYRWPQSHPQTLQVTPVSSPDPAQFFVVETLGESVNEGTRVGYFWKYICSGHSCVPWVGPSYDNGKHGSPYIALLKHDRRFVFPTWCSHNSAMAGV